MVCALNGFSPLIGFAVFLPLLLLLIFNALVSYRKERYELKSSTVLCHRGGLTSDQTNEVEICNITHVALKLPWLRHKFFGIGTIEIDSAGTSQPVVLRTITEPRAVYDRITERMKHNGYELKKEELLHEERPAIIGILIESAGIIFTLITVLLLSAGPAVSFHKELSKTGFGSISVLIVVLFVLIAFSFWLIYFLDMRRRTYRVYNDAVVYEDGFLTRRSAIIPYENIADATTNRTLWDQIFNLYDVTISCQGNSKEIKFRRLKNGINLTNCIEQLVTKANQKPSPAEAMAVRDTESKTHEIPTREEPDLISPEDAWTADLKMKPTRVLLPLLLLLPLFPLWILAMLQALIKMTCTTYTVRAGSIRHSFRFLTSSDREFAYDKITGLVVKENLWDRMLGTFTLRFWSIGSGQSLELAHLSRSSVNLDAVLRQIGIPTATIEVREVATPFSAWAWIRARCYHLLFALILMIGFVVAAVLTDENLFLLGIPIQLIFSFGKLGHAWLFYSKQKLSFQDHHIEATQGIITRHSYFARYRNVKKNVLTQYPGGKEGSLQIFVAGEQTVGQQLEQKGKGKGKVAVPCSFTIGLVPDVFAHSQLLDDILSGRVELSADVQATEPLKVIAESKRGVGNSVFTTVLISTVLFPLLLLLPLTLPLRILAIKRWRYQVEAGRVVLLWGLLFKRRASILLDRVDSLQQQQGILNKMFKNGTVSIMTAGSSNPDLSLFAVKEYQTIYQEIRKLSQKG